MKKKNLVDTKKLLGFLCVLSYCFLGSSFSFATQRSEAMKERALQSAAKYYLKHSTGISKGKIQDLIKACDDYYNYTETKIKRRKWILVGFWSKRNKLAQEVRKSYKSIKKEEQNKDEGGFCEEFESLQKDFKRWENLDKDYSQILSFG